MEAAAERKEKLKALRAKAEASAAAAPANETVVKFRNYVPRDPNISHEKVEPVKAPGVSGILPQLEALAPPAAHSLQASDVAVAPKKGNWDLRRDVEEKLLKLERRTQRAMVKLMQDEKDEVAKAAA